MLSQTLQFNPGPFVLNDDVGGDGVTSLDTLRALLEMEAGSNSLGLVLGKATDGSGSSQLLLVSCPVQLGSPLLSKESEPHLDTIDVSQDGSQ